MPLPYADRVKETASNPGTGTISLGGAATGYQAFGTAFLTGDLPYYCITDGTNWEVGQGTYTSIGNTLARTTVLSSSNAGALVNFTSTSCTIFNTFPASAAAQAMNYVNWPDGLYMVPAGVACLQVQDVVFGLSTHVINNGRMVWVK